MEVGIATCVRLTGMLVLGFVLGACGGGGGGGVDTPSGGDGVMTSLVPAPPTLGAVLVDDAAQLRPMRSGATWRYQGVATGNATYASKIQVSGSGPAFTEDRQFVFNGGTDTATVTVANGTVTTREMIDVDGSGTGQDISYVELRSPVREGDQIVVFDRRDVQTAGDIDGDRVNDRADVAAYSRVIGWESVELPALGRAVRAVRVDTAMAVRFTRSSDRQVLPALTAVQSIWYLPQVGIVRLRTTQPDTSTPGVVDSDESLVSWDGVTDGLGALSPVPGRLHVDGQPTGEWLGRPLAAVGLGDRALVVNAVYSSHDASQGATISIVSSRGQVQSIRTIDGFVTRSALKLVRLGTGAALIWGERNALDPRDTSTYIRMLRFDGQGLIRDAMPGVLLTIGIDGAEVAAAYDGSRLWLMWAVFDAAEPTNKVKLVARAFGDDGVPLMAPVVVASTPHGGQGSLALAARDGSVVATWAQNLIFGNPTRFEIKTAILDVTGVHQLGSIGTTEFVGPTAVDEARLTPFLATGARALTWGSAIFDQTGSPEIAPRGVSLASDLTPLRAVAGNADNERLTIAPLLGEPQAFMTAVGDRMVVAQTSYGVVSPTQTPTDFLQLSFATPAALPLSSTPFQGFRWTARDERSMEYFGALVEMVALDDRVLLLGHQTRGMMVSAAWPR